MTICLWLPLPQFTGRLLDGQVFIWSGTSGKGNRVIEAPSAITKLSPGILFNKKSHEG